MQPLPIFPPAYRKNNHFSPGQSIYLTELTGIITRASIKSITKESLNCIKDGGKIIAQNFRSPLILSPNELLWLKELLKPCEKMGVIDVYTDLTECSKKGNQGAIIFLNHLTLIERMHGSNPMYSPDFFRDFIMAIIATPI